MKGRLEIIGFRCCVTVTLKNRFYIGRSTCNGKNYHKRPSFKHCWMVSVTMGPGTVRKYVFYVFKSQKTWLYVF